MSSPTASVSTPANYNVLNKRIEQQSGSLRASLRLRQVVANTVIAQMLPEGVVKGGAAMNLRLGEAGSRFSEDLDAARASALDVFLSSFGTALNAGWGGFTGRIVASRNRSRPPGVPAEYIMVAYNIKLAYNTRSWMTVTFELGHDEIGDTDEPDHTLAEGLVGLFAAIGLPQPQPVPVLAVAHQVAQKLHALTGPNSERAHDLVDLQLLLGDDVSATTVDLVQVRSTCQRLFASRRSQTWPPVPSPNPQWAALYDEAATDLPVLLDVSAALTWVGDLITAIDNASNT